MVNSRGASVQPGAALCESVLDRRADDRDWPRARLGVFGDSGLRAGAGANGNVGMISGLFFGLAFGMGGIGAAVLGKLADATSIGFVYRVCAFLPAVGILTALLPNLDRPRVAPARAS